MSHFVGLVILTPKYALEHTLEDALDKYFGVPGGQMTKLDLRGRSDLAKNIIVAATGKQRGEMNLCIADCGEGQTPDSSWSAESPRRCSFPWLSGSASRPYGARRRSF